MIEVFNICSISIRIKVEYVTDENISLKAAQIKKLSYSEHKKNFFNLKTIVQPNRKLLLLLLIK